MIPSIPKIQRLIETAWEKGFDKQGCDQLGGRVVNTRKWIGATEIVATLSALKMKCVSLSLKDQHLSRHTTHINVHGNIIADTVA